MRENLIELVHNARMNALWHNAKNPSEYIADMLIDSGVKIPVPCKECKHYMTIHCTCDGCCISDDWYCADGERKTDGGKKTVLLQLWKQYPHRKHPDAGADSVPLCH